MRESAEKELSARTGATTETDLMNALQDRGLVSDNAAHLRDVPTADLIAAEIKLSKS